MAEMLLKQNSFKCLGGNFPQAPLHILARRGRTAWMYKPDAFMLMTQGMRGLYQTFHLVATALSSAPCTLGWVNVGRLGMVGIDWRDAPFIEVFTLGK